jgi:curved DNA-binding protein CbpA
VKGPVVEVKHVSPMGQKLAGDVRVIFRNLALQYHPDRGGSPDAMKALNELHDQIQELLNRTFSTP